MPTKSSWSSSSTSICHRSRPHASPHRESARTPQPPQCSGDLGNPALDLTHFFLRVEKVGLACSESVTSRPHTTAIAEASARPNADSRQNRSPGTKPGASRFLCVLGSVPGGDRAVPTELEVDAAFHDALALTNVDDGAIGERVRASAEVVVVVLDETGQPIREGIFPADADGPTAASLARRRERRSAEGEFVVVTFPGAAALHVAEETVPGITDPTGDGGQRPDPRVIGEAGKEKIVVTAMRVGPTVVALDTEHDLTDLVVAADLDAADDVVRIMAARRDAGRKCHIGPVLLRPKAADMAAEVAAGPAEVHWDRRRSLIDRRSHRQVGCHCRARDQGAERNAR